MKIAITQPNFLPWLGFFDLLDQVDLWISLDNVNFTKRSFIGRNKICTLQDKEVWLTVNLNQASQNKMINECQLNLESNWWEGHWNKIQENYKKAPFFDELQEWVFDLLKPQKEEKTLSQYNTRIIKDICGYLGVNTKIKYSSQIIDPLEGIAQDKIINLVKRVGGKEYYNFKNGVEAGLYDPDTFSREGITIFKQDYQHPEYPQLFSVFHSYLSIVDLLFHKGNGSLAVIREGTNWIQMNNL